MVLMKIQTEVYDCLKWGLYRFRLVLMEVQNGVYGGLEWSLWRFTVGLMEVQCGLWSLRVRKMEIQWCLCEVQNGD